MTRKRIALVALPPDYFWSFGQALQECGFEVYWVCLLRSHAIELRQRYQVTPTHVLDVLEEFDAERGDLDECRTGLAELEHKGGPRIHDVILMDRILRRRPHGVALRFLRHVQTIVTEFLTVNDITLVNSGRDTAPQMVIMLSARRLGIPWVVPTRARIPREMYGFCPGHETTGMIRFRAITENDRRWAEQALQDFIDNRTPRPALKRAARNLTDVARLLPVHIRLFSKELMKAVPDRGNRLSRYTIPDLMRSYVRRRMNLFRYKAFPPYAPPGDRAFCIYALHTQPESSIDVSGSFFSDQIALITFIARSLPVTHELYVKVHPTDVDGQPLSFYRRIAAIPGVRLINYDVDSRELVRRASIVFSLTGTIAYEAALVGKPVIAFANNYFNSLPTVHYCNAPPTLPALIDSLLDAPPPSDLKARMVDFFADLRTRCFVGEVNRMYGEQPASLTSEDLRTLQIAFISLHQVYGGAAAQQHAAEMTAGSGCL